MNTIVFRGTHWDGQAARGCVEGDGEVATANRGVVFSISNGSMRIETGSESLFFTNQNCDGTPNASAVLKIRLSNCATRHVHLLLQGPPDPVSSDPVTIKFGNHVETSELTDEEVTNGRPFDRQFDRHQAAFSEITI